MKESLQIETPSAGAAFKDAVDTAAPAAASEEESVAPRPDRAALAAAIRPVAVRWGINEW